MRTSYIDRMSPRIKAGLELAEKLSHDYLQCKHAGKYIR